MDESHADDQSKRKPLGPLGGRGHKESCQCKTCLRIRQMHALGQAKPPDRRRLGPRQVRKLAFVKKYTDPQSPTFANAAKSAQAVGFSSTNASNLLRDEQVRKLLITALERQGITEEQIAAKYVELLAAKETKVLSHFDEDTKKFVTEKVEVPDPHAQVKALALLHQVRGDILKEEKSIGGVQVIIRSSAIVTPGHIKHCPCETCEKGRERLAEECRKQLARTPEELERPEDPEEE